MSDSAEQETFLVEAVPTIDVKRDSKLFGSVNQGGRDTNSG